MERVAPLEAPFGPEVASDLAAMMPPGVEPLRLFRLLAHNPRVLGKIRASNLLDRGSIDRVDRELVILRTCARCGSEYEWGVHVAVFARRFGISEAKIAGTVEWDASDSRWTQKEQQLLRLVDELHAHATVSDASWVELAESFAADQLVEMIVPVGFYHTISFVTNGFQVDREPSGETFPAAERVHAG